MPLPSRQRDRIVQVLGPVVDIEFPPDQLPEIYNAARGHPEPMGRSLTLEVQQHLGNDWVRAVAMSTTDGLRRGMDAVDTGQAITVPVGPETLGRIFNVVGDPIDQAGPVEAEAVTIRSTARRPPSTSSRPRSKSSRPASRSST